MRKEIGTYTLEKDEIFTNTYETAAWYQKVLVKAGTYPVTTDGYWVFVKLPGTITEDYFQSLYCGNSFGKPYDVHQNKGQNSDHNIQLNRWFVEDHKRFNITEA